MKQVVGQMNLFNAYEIEVLDSKKATNTNIKIVSVNKMNEMKEERQNNKQKEIKDIADRINGVVTIKYLHELYAKAKQELDEIGIPYSKNVSEVLSISSRASSRYGRCRKRNSIYLIDISEFLLKGTDKGILDTLIHELLHTCPGCMNHGEKWQNYAYIVNSKLGYNIKRTNSRDEKGLERKPPQEKKYIVECTKCKQQIKRTRISKLIENPQFYKCGICGSSFVRVQ